MVEASRKDVGPMWCFKCRARLRHDFIVSMPEEEWSYYGPSAHYECERCHDDHSCFPGTWRTYEETWD